MRRVARTSEADAGDLRRMWIIIILGGLLTLATLVMYVDSAVANHRRNAARAALTARDFSGVVTEQSLVAHPFDSGYSCRIVIQCDDGSTVTWDTSASFLDRFPVGARLTHTADQRPVKDKPGTAQRAAPVEDSITDSAEESA